MKKILSLALALLMMLPLTVGVSAAKSSDVVTAEEFMDILEYWKWSNSDKDDYDDLLDYIYAGKYVREWVDSCEGCGAVALYYISKGTIYCSCNVCGKTYEIKVTDKDTSCKYCDCDDCDVSDDDCDCCKKCGCVEIDPDFTIDPEEEFGGKFNHKYSSCELDDVDFYRYGSTVYWYCDNCGRYGSFSASAWDDDWYDYFWDYRVYVSCTRGGTYEIDGDKYADHGDTRTITFEPKTGYVLYNVTVNGKEYGPASTIKLTVTDNMYVEAEFVKASSLKPCDLTATAIGNGTITAKKNGVKVAADEITAKYTDTVTYTFKPASGNYVVSSVVVNGRSIGKVSTYTLSKGITKDVDIKVTFAWKNPYSDITNENYLKAVEYVTEAGIMGYYNKYVNKNAFCGTNTITVKNLAAALAEMADVNEKLDTVEERLEWAEKYGIIDDKTDLTALCSVQTACDIVNKFLLVLETEGDVDFVSFDDEASAKENALSIKLVSETTYKNNRSISRYDLAAICYLLANLSVK